MARILVVLILLSIFSTISCEKNEPVGPTNFAPVLSNLSLPDSVMTTSISNYIFSIKCFDENGLNDIKTVLYQLESSDGSEKQSGLMYDDGDYEMHGDNIANDGKYTVRFHAELNPSTYKFSVQATDQSELESNILEDYFEVIQGQINQAPLIMKYFIPDSAIVDEILPFKICIQATEPDSGDYITKVTYKILGPKITELAEEGELNDMGISGDSLASDGIYSIETTTAFANWKFGEYHVLVNAFDSHLEISNTVYEILPWAKLNVGVPPQLLTLSAPDTIKLPTSTSQSYILSVNATDGDNNKDVKEVFFNTTKPDGYPSSGNPFFMYDDGKNGDAEADDNIYSLLIWITPENTPGDYKFEFQAKDYSELLSNKIIHTITVVE